MAALMTEREEVHALRLARSQPESAGEFNTLIEQLKNRVIEAAMSNDSVRRRLEGTRYRVLAVDYREDKPSGDERPSRLAEVYVYDYDHDLGVVAVMDLRDGSLIELFDRPGIAPPITADELEEARLLLANSDRFSMALDREGARFAAFPTPSYAFDPAPERGSHRGCTIYFDDDGGRTLSATVDLSAREVVPDEQLHETLRPRPITTPTDTKE